MHISLAAILEGIHISLVICLRGYTCYGDTHNTMTPVQLSLYKRLDKRILKFTLCAVQDTKRQASSIKQK